MVKLTPDAPEAPCLVQEVLTKDKKLQHIIVMHMTFEKLPAGVSGWTTYAIHPNFTLIPAETAALSFVKYDLPELFNNSFKAVAGAYGVAWPADSR